MTDREKFEAWYCKNYSKSLSHMERHENSGDYFCRQTRAAWRAWQAALASQQPADDGWIDWAGGECPVNINSLVNVRYRNGGGCLDSKPAEVYNWSHNDEDCYPIIAYRVVKP